MEKLKITIGEAKLNEYNGKQYVDFLRFDNEEQIYFSNYSGYDERCIDGDFGEEIIKTFDTFTIETECSETLSHEIILQLEKQPTKENILEIVKHIETYIDKKYEL